jgi:hypothetical protein
MVSGFVAFFQVNRSLQCLFSGILGGVGRFEHIAHARGFTKVELHVDSKVVVTTPASVNGRTTDGSNLLQNIRRLFKSLFMFK